MQFNLSDIVPGLVQADGSNSFPDSGNVAGRKKRVASGGGSGDDDDGSADAPHTFSDHCNKFLCRYMPKLAADVVEYGALAGAVLLVADLVISRIIRGKKYIS